MKNFNLTKSSLIFGSIYFLTSVLLMFFTYPHEDALILFRYVENFTLSGDIVFNLNSEKVEGATDFLWFLILSILNFFGVNVMLAAILVNSISLLFLLNMIQKYFLKEENLVIIIILFFIFLNIGPIFGSSLYGFSSIFFITLGFCCYVSSVKKNFITWAIFSILLCLTRPEGVLIFLPTIFIIYFLCSSHEKLTFYKSFFVITLVGLCYFLWRYYYFENFLPLPLIVKSLGGETSIRRMGAVGIQIINSLLLTVIFSIIYSFVKNYKKIIIYNKYLIPFLFTVIIWFIYLFFLSRGFLSQNIFDRYFASFYFIIFVIFLYIFSYLNKIEKIFILIILIISSLDSSNVTTRILTEDKFKFTNPTYKVFNDFSKTGGMGDHPLVKIGKSLSDKKLNIMLTEAGAIPYLSKKSNIIDLIGLNSNTFAKRPVNCDDINKISPEIIEIDVGPLNWGTFEKPENLSSFNWTGLVDDKNFKNCGLHLKSDIFDKFASIKNTKLIEKYKKTKKDNHYNATVWTAPSNVIFCLFNNDNYEQVFVNKKSDQIYFLKKGNNLSFIEKSCDIKKKGYLTDLFFE